LTTEE